MRSLAFTFFIIKNFEGPLFDWDVLFDASRHFVASGLIRSQQEGLDNSDNTPKCQEISTDWSRIYNRGPWLVAEK